jgi:hypothetical protein
VDNTWTQQEVLVPAVGHRMCIDHGVGFDPDRHTRRGSDELASLSSNVAQLFVAHERMEGKMDAQQTMLHQLSLQLASLNDSVRSLAPAPAVAVPGQQVGHNGAALSPVDI